MKQMINSKFYRLSPLWVALVIILISVFIFYVFDVSSAYKKLNYKDKITIVGEENNSNNLFKCNNELLSLETSLSVTPFKHYKNKKNRNLYLKRLKKKISDKIKIIVDDNLYENCDTLIIKGFLQPLLKKIDTIDGPKTYNDVINNLKEINKYLAQEIKSDFFRETRYYFKITNQETRNNIKGIKNIVILTSFVFFVSIMFISYLFFLINFFGKNLLYNEINSKLPVEISGYLDSIVRMLEKKNNKASEDVKANYVEQFSKIIDFLKDVNNSLKEINGKIKDASLNDSRTLNNVTNYASDRDNELFSNRKISHNKPKTNEEIKEFVNRWFNKIKNLLEHSKRIENFRIELKKNSKSVELINDYIKITLFELPEDVIIILPKLNKPIHNNLIIENFNGFDVNYKTNIVLLPLIVKGAFEKYGNYTVIQKGEVR